MPRPIILRARRRRHRIRSLGFGSSGGGRNPPAARFFRSTLSAPCLNRQKHGPHGFQLLRRSVLADGSNMVTNSPAGLLWLTGGAFVRLARNCYTDGFPRSRRALGNLAGTGRRNREALSTVRDAGETFEGFQGWGCRRGCLARNASRCADCKRSRSLPLFVRMAPGLPQPGSADASGYPGNLAGSLPAVVALLALIYGAGFPTPIGIALARS